MALLGRDTKVTGPLPEGTLLLETFQGKEALGTPYRYDLTLLSDDPNLPMDKLLLRQDGHGHEAHPLRGHPESQALALRLHP
jgi:hypothetical protein